MQTAKGMIPIAFQCILGDGQFCRDLFLLLNASCHPEFLLSLQKKDCEA